MKIVLASHNQGKLKEFKHLLKEIDCELCSLAEFSDKGAEETGLTFIENAILKARFASQKSGLPALADDSGIEVDILKGAPGIYSARFSATGDTDANNQKLLSALQAVPDDQRQARFRCVLAFLRHPSDPSPIIAEGCWEGYVARQTSGTNGFGYDSLLWIPDHQCTVAELHPDIKNTHSHRAKAMQQLLQRLITLC